MVDHNLYNNTPFDLEGKVALVSGGAGLLGKEFCKALISAGAVVYLCDSDKEAINNAEREINSEFMNPNLLIQLLDVIEKESIKKCIETILKKNNSIDILVNSAAIDPKFDKEADISNLTEFTNYPKDLWQRSLDVNLTGMFLLTQEVCKIMEKSGQGSIINIGSNYGLVGPDQRIYKKKGEACQSYKPADYSVCKAGIIGFTKYLAAYYAGTKIRVNVLTPSGVFNDHSEEFAENYSSRTILRRMSKKNEYWGSIIFLASEASSYMTGANLIIDGGWTAL